MDDRAESTASSGAGGRLVPADNVATQRVDEELVLLNYDTERYFGLDAMGTAIWDALVDAPSIDEGITRLLAEFDVEPDRLRADVSALVDKLVEGGLVAIETD